jgi:response regulator RpfG family c-di-GMP phosphodiesterase
MKANVKLLYVDDEPINLQLFNLNFSKYFDVLTASNAYEGLEILQQYSDEIEIVISDMHMPEINGLEFIKQAKECYPLKKYYMLSGFDMTPEINKAIHDGLILKYFSKPLNMKEILNSIREAIDCVSNLNGEIQV